MCHDKEEIMSDLNRAITLVENGQVDEGLAIIKDIEKQSDHETKFSIAELYYNWGLVDKAKSIIDELLLLYPDEGELYIFAAELLIDLDDEDEAIEMLLEVRHDDPQFLRALLLLADLYQLQGLDEVAEEKLRVAEKHSPDEPIISYGLGEFYLERGDFLRSIPYYKKALAAKDQLKDINIELRLGEAFGASGQFEEALTYYEKGLKDDVELSALFGYAYTALQLAQYKTSIEAFNRLKDMDPQYTSLYPYLANAYEAEHLYEEAVQTLEEGIKVDEYNESLYLAAGKLSLKLKDTKQAEDYLRTLLSLNPSHFEGTQTLAALLKHEERFSEVVELIEHCQGYGEEDPLFDWFLANAKHEEEQFEEALQLYNRAKEHFHHDPDFLEEYGYFLLEMGQRGDALVILRKSLALDHKRIELEEKIFDLESSFDN